MMENKNKIYNTSHIIWGVFLSFILSNVLYYIINPKDSYFNDIWFKNPSLLAVSIVSGVLIYLVLFIVLNFTIKNLDRLNFVKKEISYYLIISNTVVILTMLLLLFIENLFYEIFLEKSFLVLDQNNFNVRIYFVIHLLIATMFNSYYSVIYFFNKWSDKERYAKELLIETHLLKEIALQTELQVYKMQLDPHFLFNSFSVLTHLVDTDTTKAQLYLENLSKVYRYILLNSKKDLVTIDTELALILAYYELIKIRHQENIHLNIDISSSTKQMAIPPVTLQLLVENAIKHNKQSADNPLYVTITDHEKGYLQVSNNAQKIKLHHESIGVGVENIKQRYALLSEVLPVFIDEEDTYTVKLPLLKF